MEPKGNCRYCGHRITENEYFDDRWEGGSEGFYEYHWSCIWPDPDGRFAIVEITSVFTRNAEAA